MAYNKYFTTIQGWFSLKPITPLNAFSQYTQLKMLLHSYWLLFRLSNPNAENPLSTLVYSAMYVKSDGTPWNLKAHIKCSNGLLQQSYLCLWQGSEIRALKILLFFFYIHNHNFDLIFVSFLLQLCHSNCVRVASMRRVGWGGGPPLISVGGGGRATQTRFVERRGRRLGSAGISFIKFQTGHLKCHHYVSH